MADNYTTNPGSGGNSYASDDIAGVHYPYVKLAYGPNNSAMLVSDSNPLPIDDANGSLTVDNDGTFPVQAAQSGVWTVSLSATDNAVLDQIDSNTDYGTVVGGGTQAGALRVTLASDSSGVLSVDDNGGSLTIDGTVTADLSATDNAVLDQIDSNTDFGVVVGGGVEANALRVTLANDSTGVLSVDDGGASISVDDGGGAITVDGEVTANLSATDNAVLDDIEANTTGLAQESGGNLATLAGAIAGSEMQVDVVTMPGTAAEAAALPSSFVVVAGDDGTDTHPLQLDSAGRLQVDIAADSVGIGGGVQYTEDAVAPANPVGTQPVMVRADTPAGVASADGDVVAQRGTNYGAAYVQVVDSSGNFIDTFGGAGGTSATDDGGFTPGVGLGTPMMGLVTADPVDSGDVGVVAMSTDRRLHVDAQIVGQDASVNVSDGGGSLTIDGAVTANLSATDNAVLDAIDSNTTPSQSHYRNIDANAEDAIKGSGGILHWLHVMNMTASVAYLHLYDATTASVNPGTTTPDFTFPIPTQGDTNGAGFTLRIDHEFSTAITLVVTTTTDGSAGDPGTNGVFVNAGYT